MSTKGRIITSKRLDYDKLVTTGKKLIGSDRYSERTFGLYLLTALTTGLRYSDLMQLTHDDLRKGEYKLREVKRGKKNWMSFNPSLLALYKKHIKNGTGLLFRSENRDTPWSNTHINNRMVFYFGNEGVSSHSLRKTFGYRYYSESEDKTGALYELSVVFNHSSVTTTSIYIGVQREELESKQSEFFKL